MPKQPMRQPSGKEVRGKITGVHSRRQEPGSARLWAVVGLLDQSGERHVIEGLFTQADLDAQSLVVQGTERSVRPGVERLVAERVWRGPLGAWASAPPVEGLVRFMAEGGVRGEVSGFSIGPARARALGEALGEDLWRALSGDTGLLALHVRGEANAVAIQDAIASVGLETVNALSRLMVLNLSLARAKAILDQMGVEAIATIEKDPYAMTEVRGIAFATADRIALDRLGVSPEDPRRLRAMVRSVVHDAGKEAGATSVPIADVLDHLSRMIEGAGSPLRPEDVLDLAVAGGAVQTNMGDVYLPRRLRNEQAVARAVVALASTEGRRLPLGDALAEVVEGLSDEQIQAVTGAFTQPLLTVTGPPGSGKTHIIRAILSLAEKEGIPVSLSASTGKAADKINAGLPASTQTRAVTTHSLMGKESEAESLPAGILVVDEATLLDLDISARLLSAAASTPGRTHVVLLGDPEQLESVMPGAVFRDLCESPQVPTVRLTRIFRQDRDSLIAINGERIRRGLAPFFHNTRLSRQDMAWVNETFAGEEMSPADIQRNVYLVPAGDPENGARRVLDCVRRWAHLGYDPQRQIMVISPVREKHMGTKNLNRLLQESLNPEGECLRTGDRDRDVIRDQNGIEVRVGSPIMLTRNEDQKRGLINGTRGIVRGLNDEGLVEVEFPAAGLSCYTKADVRQMLLAYAITGHKSQGEEVDVVIFALHESEHFINMKRTLLTVGSTRATRQQVYVASPRAIRIALSRVEERHTRLAERIELETGHVASLGTSANGTPPTRGKRRHASL